MATPPTTTPVTTAAPPMGAGGAATGSTAPAPTFEFKDYEDSPGSINRMFGSLMQVLKSTPTVQCELVDNWWKIIQKWYPDMHSQVYTVPPVHFNSVSYKPKPEKSTQPLEPYERFNMYMYKPSLYSTVKDDEAQQRSLWTISSFLEWKNSKAFVLSNMEFQNYLNKDYAPAAGAKLPHYTRPNMKNQEGDVDVLVIHKEQGVFVFEVKAIGDSDAVRQTPEQDKLTEICTKLEKTVIKQMNKERQVLQDLLNVLDPNKNIKVRAGLVLVNTRRKHLKQAVHQLTDAVLHNLKQAMGLDPADPASTDKISDITLCADDMPGSTLEGSPAMNKQILEKVDKVWTALRNVDGDSKPMDDGLYEHIVALFCGPLTTVKICTEKSMPRVRLSKKIVGKGKNAKEKTNVFFQEVRTAAGAARKVAIRFSELVLQKDQIAILQRDEDFVHLQGPPGTGKTLLLLLRILTWLDAGHRVWIISFFPPSRSVTHVLFDQTKRMLDAFYATPRVEESSDAEENSEVEESLEVKESSEAKERKDLLGMFILARPQETLDKKYYERRLHKFRDRAKHKDPYPDAGYPRRPTLPAKALPQDRKVCLVVDESGMSGKALDDFFDQVAVCHKRKDFLNTDQFNKGLSVWSASVERCGRPKYAAKPGKNTEEKFGTCWKLKMPLRCPPTVQRALMLVQPSLDARNICFFKKQYMMANPAFPMDKSKVTKPAEEGPAGLYNQYPADGLPVFLIAHGSHEKAHEDVWYCKECGNELADYLTKVLKIGTPEDQQVMSDVPLKCQDVMIVATQNSFQFSLPIAGFMLAMKKRKLKVAVNTTREEGKTAITDEDTILIVDMTSVHGLERAVIVIVPEVNMPPQLPTMYKTFFTTPEESKEIRQDDPMKEALEEAEGKNFSISAAGEFKKEDDSDDENTTADTGNKDTPMEVQGEQSQPEASQSSVPSQPQKIDTDGKGEDYDTSDEEDEGIDSLTYADNESERKIKAALASLSDQSRKDIFYIGSRAVCQLILVHRGKKDDGDAPIPPDDIILIVDLTSVHGLERAVIIIIPEVKPPPPLPRSLLLNPLYEDKLPLNVRDLIEVRQSEGKDGIILTADGEEEEDLSDVEESLPESVDPAFVKHDPNIKESMEAGEDLVMTGDGKHLVEEEVPGNRVRVADVEMKGAGSSDGSQRPAPEEEDVEMKDVSGRAEQAGQPPASPPTPDQASEQNKSKTAYVQEEPYRYTDTHSKKQIQAAIDSMSKQSRQDMFYIGSRAVCQLILVHPGKDPEKKKKKKKAAEPMQTDTN